MVYINFSPFPILRNDRLILRQVQINDVDEYFILKSDERMLEFLGYSPKSFDEARKKLLEINNEIAKNESITWGITLKNENELVGTICFWNISKENTKAEIGYELLSNYQGIGIMQSAIKLVIEYAFKKMKLTCIEAFPNPNHLQSKKLLERNNFIIKGENSERVIYELKG